MKKRIAKKILKYRDRLRYTPKQIRRAEEKLKVGQVTPSAPTEKTAAQLKRWQSRASQLHCAPAFCSMRLHQEHHP
ncbi:MAG: hypothetical protein QHJ34_05680 [bacterium]|jgi:hypothetical protein|nr:hypothetical protein [candidate division KSB1 bacterium]MDH7559709.1 hypothetical protein [bacterium]